MLTNTSKRYADDVVDRDAKRRDLINLTSASKSRIPLNNRITHQGKCNEIIIKVIAMACVRTGNEAKNDGQDCQKRHDGANS